MYKHKDIKVVLETMLSDKTTDLIAYKQVIADFCNKVPNKNVLRCVFQCEEFEAICEKFNIENAQDYPYVEEDIENMLKMFYDLFELPLHDNEKENLIMTFVKNFAFCSDDEECCENKIYIVVKNLANEDSDFVQEYDSWDEATKEVDEWYTSCCDDLYLADKNMPAYSFEDVTGEKEYEENKEALNLQYTSSTDYLIVETTQKK